MDKDVFAAADARVKKEIRAMIAEGVDVTKHYDMKTDRDWLQCVTREGRYIYI